MFFNQNIDLAVFVENRMPLIYNTNMDKLTKANLSMTDELAELYKDVTSNMRAKGIFQWDYDYPSRQTVIDAINRGDMYCLVIDNAIVSAVVLNENQDEVYKEINWSKPDGKWLVVHTFSVNCKFQGKGYATKTIQLWESLAKENGYAGIRLDTYPYNKPAMNLYLKHNYKITGGIRFLRKPLGKEWYVTFDKVL